MVSKAPHIDYKNALETLKALLSRGPAKASEAIAALGMSQAAFSKMSRNLPGEILCVRIGRENFYALQRDIRGVRNPISIHAVDEKGKVSESGRLFAIHPRGFYSEGMGFFEDMPYFLDDLRPSGFLGRLIPYVHPELEAPGNIEDWTADDAIRYLTRFGCDLIGNLIVGDAAFDLYIASHIEPAAIVKAKERSLKYPQLALEILRHGDPGSSAGGEQPKFPAIAGLKPRPVLVKFSPATKSEVGRRRADLLACEHLALETIRECGHSAASSYLIEGGRQIFLEVERFDRTEGRGRKGLISLRALSAEFTGMMGAWSDAAVALEAKGIIDKQALREVRWREMFGHFIANTDMHQANISFYFEAGKVSGLAPAYDMLPMLYAPRSEQIIEQDFHPPIPSSSNSDIWKEALAAGISFWKRASKERMISASFRKIASKNLGKLTALLPLGEIFRD